MEEKTLQAKIMWYIERIVEHLSESQARSILAMLARFFDGKGA